MMKITKHFGSPKGQGIIEYLLLFAVVILIAFFFFRKYGPFSTAYNEVVAEQGEKIMNIAETVFNLN